MSPGQKPCQLAHQLGVRVSTRVQLGSWLAVSRSNVHRSMTSTAVCGSPSSTLPSASRRRLICSLLNRTVIARVSAAHLGAGHLGRRHRGQLSVELLTCRLALVDRALETVVDVVSQERPERGLVALGVGFDDHLKGGARAAEEFLQIEPLIREPDLGQARFDAVVGRSGDRRFDLGC